MTRTKQILLAGFAVLSSLLLPACGTTVTGPELAALSPLVAAPAPLQSVSYLADYSQDGALPFTCEVRMRSDMLVRRDYVWKDEKGAEKKVTVIINGEKAVRIEDGKSSDIADSATEMTRFLAGLVFTPDTVISSADENVRTAQDGSARYIYWVRLNDVPGVESCVLDVDPKSRLWTGLHVRMAGNSGTFISTFPEYQTISGVTFPARIISSTGDGAPVLCIIREVKINPELPDEIFQLSGPQG